MKAWIGLPTAGHTGYALNIQCPEADNPKGWVVKRFTTLDALYDYAELLKLDIPGVSAEGDE